GHELHRIEDSLRSRALLVEEVVRGQTADRHALQQRVVRLGGEIDTRITLIEAGGRVRAESTSPHDPYQLDNHGRRPEVEAAREDRFGTATRHSSTTGQTMMYLALRTEAGAPEV